MFSLQKHRWSHGTRVMAGHTRRITRGDRGGVVTCIPWLLDAFAARTSGGISAAAGGA
jgi:hypothetical protein